MILNKENFCNCCSIKKTYDPFSNKVNYKCYIIEGIETIEYFKSDFDSQFDIYFPSTLKYIKFDFTQLDNKPRFHFQNVYQLIDYYKTVNKPGFNNCYINDELISTFFIPECEHIVIDTSIFKKIDIEQIPIKLVDQAFKSQITKFEQHYLNIIHNLKIENKRLKQLQMIKSSSPED